MNNKPLVRLIDPDTETWTPCGIEFSKAVEAALNPILDKYMEEGVSSIDMGAIMDTHLNYVLAMKRVRRRFSDKIQHEAEPDDES